MNHEGSLDALLAAWPFRPDHVQARLISRHNRRDALQMRIEMGLLQMEIEGRPDGSRPGGYESQLDRLIARGIAQPDFEITEADAEEAERELVQFHQRRLCWVALREFRRAVADADHALSLMDFLTRHSAAAELVARHQRYRPVALFHRAQSAASAELEDQRPDLALDALNRGIDDLRAFFREFDHEDAFETDELVGKLRALREELREQSGLGATLAERLSQAVAAEHYELAARLRDEIARRAN